MTSDGRVVIVGSGHAGFQAAASLRQLKYPGEVVLAGEEPGLPYHRPPLSKEFLAGKVAEDGLRLRPAAFYAKSAINLRDGVRVAAIDRADARIVLSDGERLAYDHLVLATGARHRLLDIPGHDLDGVLALRTRAEAAVLRDRVAAAREIVVVGAGFIGLEFSAFAIGGARVTVLEMAPRPLARAISAPMAHAIVAAQEGWGVRFRTGVSAAAFHGTGGRVTEVETSEGDRLPADLVLVGIGVRPNVELAAAAGLATEAGILVDQMLATSDPAISAIGDCAAYPSPYAGGVVRVESVQNAADQGRCVAERIAGRPAPYARVPWFWSDQGTLRLQIVGLAADHDESVLRGDPASGAFSVCCFRAGRLCGVESLNAAADHLAARKLMESGGSVTPGQAADPGIDLCTAMATQSEARIRSDDGRPTLTRRTA